MLTRIIDPAAAPNTGAYSPALKVGDFVFVSGQGPIDPSGNIVAGSIESEVALTLDNIRRLLAAAGARMDQVSNAPAISPTSPISTRSTAYIAAILVT